MSSGARSPRKGSRPWVTHTNPWRDRRDRRLLKRGFRKGLRRLNAVKDSHLVFGETE